MRRSAVPEPRVPLSHRRIADKSSESNRPPESEEGDDRDAFPENSWGAWSCLVGSFLMMFPSFGFQTAGKKIVTFNNTQKDPRLCLFLRGYNN
jgi:hypothetical protein